MGAEINTKWFSVQENNECKNQREKISYFQVQNSAGGFSYRVDDITLLKRLLILGTESSTYYYNEKELRREGATCIDRLIINGRGHEVVEHIKDISVNGRACKQDTTIYALALCARSNDPETKTLAYKILSEVCRIPTHLFLFITNCENESAGTGWGRAHRRAISSWYNGFADDPLKLAYLVTKYRSRNNWSHKDVLRLAHVTHHNQAIGLILRYITKGIQEVKNTSAIENMVDTKIPEVIRFLNAVEDAKSCKNETILARLIETFQLVREHVPTELLKSSVIWETLLHQMPMTAMIRNLGKVSSLKLAEKGSENESKILSKLNNKNQLHRSRVHPFKILVGLGQYKKGHGEKGKLKWSVNQSIVKGLENAFHLAFVNVEPTGKRFLVAVDVSGSMNTAVFGNPSVTARDAAAAMMMLTVRVETNVEVVAFSDGLTVLDIGKEDTLTSVIKTCAYMDFSRTDCSLPILHAIEKKKNIDVFIIYTDSETYFGSIHPSEALKMYRKMSGIHDARLIVVAMATNGFSIADPDDPFMLDVIGFDTDAPAAMEHFINGKTL
ncbi:hypothetical protein KUTeg_022666 [Tegillarca granosa]|uniref:TROVE domain-containing protein n=1 Tax=Tegillarca granosa TaxID=220873 RepID=A0ABQ9E2H7_TEGGR|nr:hypothetical protein KUTeg_022666 [Tegillarca granosa]